MKINLKYDLSRVIKILETTKMSSTFKSWDNDKTINFSIKTLNKIYKRLYKIDAAQER